MVIIYSVEHFKSWMMRVENKKRKLIDDNNNSNKIVQLKIRKRNPIYG